MSNQSFKSNKSQEDSYHEDDHAAEKLLLNHLTNDNLNLM